MYTCCPDQTECPHPWARFEHPCILLAVGLLASLIWGLYLFNTCRGGEGTYYGRVHGACSRVGTVRPMAGLLGEERAATGIGSTGMDAAALGTHMTENPSLGYDSSPNPGVPAAPYCTIPPHPGCPHGMNKGRVGRAGLWAVSLWWGVLLCPRRFWGADSKQWGCDGSVL